MAAAPLPQHRVPPVPPRDPAVQSRDPPAAARGLVGVAVLGVTAMLSLLVAREHREVPGAGSPKAHCCVPHVCLNTS